MLAFPSMLEPAAREAGMAVPADPENYEAEKEAFPHFFVFCAVQLGSPMPTPTAHWENAKLIAAIPEDQIRNETGETLTERGLQIGYSK